MRVAYICTDPGIPVFGTKGASVHIQEVLFSLLKKGATITLFAQRLGGEPPSYLSSIKIQPLPALPSSNPEDRAKSALAANEIVIQLLEQNGEFDIVYERYSLWSHAGMTFACNKGIVGILEANAPLIEEQKKYRELPLEFEAEKVMRTALKNASTIIAVSPGVKAYFDQFSESVDRVHVVSNGVDPMRFSASNPGEHNNITIGFLGTLKPWHGLQTLIAAFILLRQRHHNITLSIIGDGPEYGTIEAQLRLQGLLPYCRFSGAVEPQAVPALLAEMDIAIAPYPKLDNFYFSPLKIYEYMAAGLPVITTRVGHLASIVEEGVTGLLVSPEQPEALCIAIEQLLNDRSLLKQLGIAGRKLAETKHSWDAVVSKILDFANITKFEKEMERDEKR